MWEADVRQTEDRVRFLWAACGGSKVGRVFGELACGSSKKLALFLAVGHSPYKEKQR